MASNPLNCKTKDEWERAAIIQCSVRKEGLVLHEAEVRISIAEALVVQNSYDRLTTKPLYIHAPGAARLLQFNWFNALLTG